MFIFKCINLIYFYVRILVSNKNYNLKRKKKWHFSAIYFLKGDIGKILLLKVYLSKLSHTTQKQHMRLRQNVTHLTLTK